MNTQKISSVWSFNSEASSTLYNSFLRNYKFDNTTYSSLTKCELEIYFVFHLLASLRSLKQSEETQKEVTMRIINQISKDYDSKLSNTNLHDLIFEKVNSYGNYKDSPKDLVNNLILNLKGSRGNKLELNYPVLIMDVFQDIQSQQGFIHDFSNVLNEYNSTISNLCSNTFNFLELSDNEVLDRLMKVQSSPKYKTQNKTKKKEGCYVATMVYGSYDCNEVMVLRNYRDSVLKQYTIGRLFISIYYSLSPYFVKIFKKSNLVNTLIRRILDMIIKKLNC